MEPKPRPPRQRATRAAIVGAWTLLSALSIWVAFARPTPLAATLERQQTEHGSILLIRNEDSTPWPSARVTVNGEWYAERGALRRDDTWLVGPLDLTAATYVPLELGDPWLDGAPGLERPRAVPSPAMVFERARLEVGGTTFHRELEPAR